MVGLYLLSIVIAWLVEPNSEKESGGAGPATLRLVIGAVVVDQARKRSRVRVNG